MISIYGCGAGQDPGARSEIPGSSRLSELLRDDGNAGFPRVTDAREFRFPEDHGPHPDYRNEWWYLTGNLDGSSGERFGYELTLFRFSLAPGRVADAASSWRTHQVFIGHFAVTDVQGAEFHVAQRYSRAHPELAGAEADPPRVWIDDWEIATTGERGGWRLAARDDGIGLSLALSPSKPVVLNGVDGLSQKSAEPGNASYYYSIPRLESSGRLTLGETTFEVTGMSWLDREWGSSALGAGQQGWDWFALQLSDGTELMYYQLRGTDGDIDPYSAGTLIGADGSGRPLSFGDVELNVEDSWVNDRGDRYPSAWRISVPAEGISLAVEPVLADQELVTTVRYWEGAVDVRGRSGGTDVSGRGYVELTGYAGAP